MNREVYVKFPFEDTVYFTVKTPQTNIGQMDLLPSVPIQNCSFFFNRI